MARWWTLRGSARSSIVALVAATALGAALGGCKIFGAVAYFAEKDKKIEIPPEYDGLQNETVAVVVQADMATLYEHPTVPANIATNVSHRIQMNVAGVTVRDPREVLAWQYQTPGWMTLPYGDIARELDVDRVVYIDMYEYRLNPPGNRWLWEGVCAANVGIIEREGLDPDSFSHTYNVVGKFPPIEGVGRDNATQSQIETGVIVRFIEEASWLFYTHIQPKYPNDRADAVQ
ncbi:MAG: hypothetical protein U0575_12915 [Phycisphaerales bacterium]